MLNSEEVKMYRNKLEEEKNLLERELSSLGTKNPKIHGDWQPVPPYIDTSASDKSEMADEIESFEEVSATQGTLEERYNGVIYALKKIDDDSYGICEVCGKPIEIERLNANPAAVTCIKHRDIRL